MAGVASLTYNPFAENTYIVSDDSGTCAIFDPGCYENFEREDFLQYISDHRLNPVRLINTHCHVDHIFGNAFVAETFNIGLEIHQGELPVLQSGMQIAQMYGLRMEESPQPSAFIEAGDIISIGDIRLKALYTPGHSPASLSFYDKENGYVIAGDVLFQGSIGPTDLPGGNYDTLIASIKSELLVLDDDVIVYPGHGPATTVGAERRTNPFLQ